MSIYKEGDTNYGNYPDNFTQMLPKEQKSDIPTFRNPLFMGADPNIKIHNGLIYYPFAKSCGDYEAICLKVTDSFAKLKTTPETEIWRSNDQRNETEFNDVWAPEIYFTKNKEGRDLALIDFAARPKNTILGKRHELLTVASTEENSNINFGPAKRIDTGLEWAIDASRFKNPWDNQDYIVFSGIKDELPESGYQYRSQHIFVSRVNNDNPTQLDTEPVIIDSPDESYARENPFAPVKEGPTVIVTKSGFKLFSAANHSLTPDYCITSKINPSKNVLDKDSWIPKSEPEFRRTKQIGGPGHMTLFNSFDNNELWLAYHGTIEDAAMSYLNPTDYWLKRYCFIQPVTNWEMGFPILGEPLDPQTKIPYPSGDPIYKV